jgi:hypothetical protein
MRDLLELNRRIVEHWLGPVDVKQEAYLAHIAVCLGELAPSADELMRLLAAPDGGTVRAVRLNRRYLCFARLAAKEIAADRPEDLVKLGVDLAQAEILRRLTDEEVDRLAFVYGGPIVRFARETFERGAALHERAALLHAVAFVATRLVERKRRRS